MAKTKISEYDSTASNNTDVDGINIAESCPPSGINNAIREVMAHLKDLQSGVSGDTIPVASGGTGATTASGARTNLGLGTVSTLNSIATANIDADAINGTKIADDSIDSEHYVDGSIDTAHLADDAVTSSKIATNAVDATALNVSGNGTSGQALTSDGDGSFSWDTVSAITASSLSSNGYVTFTGGLKVQWGTASLPNVNSTTVSFPSAFSSACYVVLVSGLSQGTGNTWRVPSKSTTGFTLTFDFCCSPTNNGTQAMWIAIGK